MRLRVFALLAAAIGLALIADRGAEAGLIAARRAVTAKCSVVRHYGSLSALSQRLQHATSAPIPTPIRASPRRLLSVLQLGLLAPDG